MFSVGENAPAPGLGAVPQADNAFVLGRGNPLSVIENRQVLDSRHRGNGELPKRLSSFRVSYPDDVVSYPDDVV